MSSKLQALPSVDQVLREIASSFGFPSSVVVQEIRTVIAARRELLQADAAVPEASIRDEVEQRLQELLQPSLRPVINATGIILHTNLGRAPLTKFQPIEGYSNLEFDLQTGRRGKRDVHTAGLLQRLLQAPAIVVNNNAAAVYLVLHELAFGAEVLVSRGELIEIGDGFRIPEIMTRSGALLREVGTTNRTHLDDYRNAITEKTRLILRVHPSNFQITGFTARPELRALSELGKEHGIPVYEDLGSGCLVDLKSANVREPLVAHSLQAGVNLVSFSCDKLLGGPQSGIISGDAELVARVRRNPMYRAFRVDKLVIEALEKTLRELLKQDWAALPALRMIFSKPEELRARAQRVADQLQSIGAEIEESASPIGGGSTPDQTLPTWIVKTKVDRPNRFEAMLRKGNPPVIARIESDLVVLDMRTVADSEEDRLVAAVLAVEAPHH